MTSLLVLNAGSSSLKFAIFSAAEEPALVRRGQVSGIGAMPRFEADGESRSLRAGTTLLEALEHTLAWLASVGFEPSAFNAVAHRIVHGGTKYLAPTLVDQTVLSDLDALRALAPLHLPSGLGVLRTMLATWPKVKQIACFDTAFHATQDPLAKRLPLPRSYHERGYRRYGFHGLNYEHVVASLPKITGKPLPQRLLVAHLGSGASMCGIRDGKSIATTMGFSTADGLVMGTRTGSIDPGVLVSLIRDDHLSLEKLEDLLYRRSGLVGISGLSADMRILLASEAPESKEAIDYYCYSAARHAGSLMIALGGCDAFVFTGGVGENASAIRAKIIDYLSWLGFEIDAERNHSQQVEISPGGVIRSIYIVPANEELTMARSSMLCLQ